jgi:hypothetical protein
VGRGSVLGLMRPLTSSRKELVKHLEEIEELREASTPLPCRLNCEYRRGRQSDAYTVTRSRSEGMINEKDEKDQSNARSRELVLRMTTVVQAMMYCEQ